MSPSTAAARIPASARPGLAVLTLATFIAITTELLPVGLLTPMSSTFGVNEATMGLMVSVYALAVTVLALPVTFATTGLPRKRLLLATLASYALSNLVIALAPTFAVAAIGRGLGGLAHALFFSVITAYASHLVPHELVGRALATVYAGISLGSILGLPVATTIGTAFGWPVAFAAVGMAAALLGVLALVVLPTVPGNAKHERSPASNWWRRGLVTVAAVNGMLYLGHFTLYTFITPLVLSVGVALDALGPTLLLLGAAGVVGLWIAGGFIDRRPRRLMLAMTGVLLASLGALVALVPGGVLAGVLGPGGAAGVPGPGGVLAGVLGPVGAAGAAGGVLGLGPVGLLVAVLAACCLWTLTLGALPSLFMTAAVRTGGAPPDVVGALINMASNIGIGLGSAAGGVVYASSGLGTLPVFALVLVAVSFVMMVFARRAFPGGSPARRHLTDRPPG